MRVISGGQTGADRAGLDVAIELGISVGGACPKGRRAEDGEIPARYPLTETRSSSYPERTRRNVLDADATVVLTLAATATGGSRQTIAFAQRAGKPVLHIARDGTKAPATALDRFLNQVQVRTLNIAGSRESKEPGVHAWACTVLREVLGARLRAKGTGYGARK